MQRYNTRVRMGNWLEEIHLQSVVLDATDEFLKYGQDMQLVCRHVIPDVRLPAAAGASGLGDVFLSCTTGNGTRQTDGDDGDGDEFGPGWAVTASSFAEPCVRNCFKIRGFGRDCEDGKPLKFGDTFAISPCVSSEPLFVAAAVPRLYVDKGISGHPALKLVDAPTGEHCRWTASYWNVALRDKAKGLPIPNGARAILRQTVTNQNVAVETDVRLAKIFGYEYEVSAHTYKDSRGRDKAQNVWQLIASNRPESEDDRRDDDGTDEK